MEFDWASYLLGIATPIAAAMVYYGIVQVVEAKEEAGITDEEWTQLWRKRNDS